MTNETPSSPPKYHQIVLIQLNDAPKFARYIELMAPIVRRFGGALERALAPEALYGEGFTKPDAINVVHYDSRDAYTSFNEHPDFRAIEHLRSESITMASVGGVAVRGESVSGDASGRLYLLELARFGPAGAVGYRAYEEQAEPLMSRYGYHVERVIQPDSAAGLPFTPDVAKVAYFDAPDGMERLHLDPAHERIEKELYPAAVAESIWVVARSRG
jgi:uncharacterized protein (DUF1330 family)